MQHMVTQIHLFTHIAIMLTCWLHSRAERNGPSALTAVTNTLLRRSLRATRTLAGAASWAATRMLGAQRPDNGFTIQVKTHGGQCFSLDVVRPTVHLVH